MLMQRISDADRIITPDEVHSLMETDTAYLILDVRTKEEFNGESGHIVGALLIPVQELDARLADLEPHRQKLIVAVCRSGNRSGHATSMLNEKGFRAVNMVGGMVRWNAEHRPILQETRP